MEIMCFPKFQAAAAAAATFELRTRLLAQLATEGTPVHRAAIGSKLSELVEDVAAHFHAAEDEAKYLKACAQIRNKLFHLELSRVTGRIEPLLKQLVDAQLDKGQVWTIHLDTGKSGAVSGTSTQDEGIYGWMLESTMSGAFDAVVSVMENGQKIITRLRDELYKNLPSCP